ncbi:MAG: MipA/OmpV family protein [Methyloligellaceae bacterium]
MNTLGQGLGRRLATLIASGITVFAVGVLPAVAGGDTYKPEQKSTRVKIGGAALVAPKYEGSNDYEVIGFPTVSLGTVGGRLTVDGADSVKYALHKKDGFEFGPLVGYRFGRDEDDGELLTGLGDVDGGLVVGAYAKYWIGSAYLSASYHQQVTGDDTGYEIKLKAGAERELSDRVKVDASVGATYSSDEYMDSFFSVPSGGGTTAGAYDADAGFKSIHANLGMTIVLSDRWEAKVSGQYTRLLDEAGDSTVVESKDQFMGLVGLSYSFDWPGRSK